MATVASLAKRRETAKPIRMYGDPFFFFHYSLRRVDLDSLPLLQVRLYCELSKRPRHSSNGAIRRRTVCVCWFVSLSFSLRCAVCNAEKFLLFRRSSFAGPAQNESCKSYAILWSLEFLFRFYFGQFTVFSFVLSAPSRGYAIFLFASHS